jgi:hypothetical protein
MSEQKDVFELMQLIERFERRLQAIEKRLETLERNRTLQEPNRYQVVDAVSKR